MKPSSWISKLTGKSITLDNLQDVLILQLRDLYSAEDQLLTALPLMAAGANSAELKAAFNDHTAQTREHRSRLERCFSLLGCEVQSETCEAMEGLIEEGNEVLSLSGDPEVKDAALVAAAQRVEHYEIAGYGCARTFARQLGQTAVASLLQETLDEEGDTDKRLTDIAESFVNLQAARS